MHEEKKLPDYAALFYAIPDEIERVQRLILRADNVTALLMRDAIRKAEKALDEGVHVHMAAAFYGLCEWTEKSL